MYTCMIRNSTLIIILLLVFSEAFSQKKEKGKIFISEDAKPTLELNPEAEEEEEEEKKKKKKKKKVF